VSQVGNEKSWTRGRQVPRSRTCPNESRTSSRTMTAAPVSIARTTPRRKTLRSPVRAQRSSTSQKGEGGHKMRELHAAGRSPSAPISASTACCCCCYHTTFLPSGTEWCTSSLRRRPRPTVDVVCACVAVSLMVWGPGMILVTAQKLAHTVEDHTSHHTTFLPSGAELCALSLRRRPRPTVDVVCMCSSVTNGVGTWDDPGDSTKAGTHHGGPHFTPHDISAVWKELRIVAQEQTNIF
jgi:hypothetical protein